MATIVRRPGKNGQISYRAQVRRKGAPPLSATFTKLTDAKKWIQITEAAILEGRHFKTIEAKRHTLADLIERYLVEVMPQKRPRTSYTQTLYLIWWKAQLGYALLSDITPACLVAYRDRLAPGHAPATVNRYLQTLSAVFTVAVQELSWMDENPLCKVRKAKEPRGRIRFLSDDERARLLDACQRSRNKYLYTIVILALSTGARKGELLSLHWSDIDLKRGILIFRETKNGETRAVLVSGYVLAILAQYAKIWRRDISLVFPNSTGEKPLDIRDAWEYAVERAGISNFRFHDLRHSAASYLAMGGASLAEIAEVLGHKTLQMTKRYTHLTESHTRGVVERMNQTIFGK